MRNEVVPPCGKPRERRGEHTGASRCALHTTRAERLCGEHHHTRIARDVKASFARFRVRLVAAVVALVHWRAALLFAAPPLLARRRLGLGLGLGRWRRPTASSARNHQVAAATAAWCAVGGRGRGRGARLVGGGYACGLGRRSTPAAAKRTPAARPPVRAAPIRCTHLQAHPQVILSVHTPTHPSTHTATVTATATPLHTHARARTSSCGAARPAPW